MFQGEEFSTASSNLAETSERYQSASKNGTQKPNNIVIVGCQQTKLILGFFFFSKIFQPPPPPAHNICHWSHRHSHPINFGTW